MSQNQLKIRRDTDTSDFKKIFSEYDMQQVGR